jgi:Zn-dependent peptidase ImmA (M78 family)
MNDWLHGVLVPPLSIKDIRRYAESIRASARLGPADSFPVLTFLEHALPGVLPEFDFEIVEELADQDEACAYPDGCQDHPHGPLIRLTTEVYEGAYAGSGRARMTVTHECAHVLLHRQVAVHPRGPRGSDLKPYRNSEWQATQLAAELLMPLPSLERYATLAEFCRRMGVSRQAAQVRATKLIERDEAGLARWCASSMTHDRKEVREMYSPKH